MSGIDLIFVLVRPVECTEDVARHDSSDPCGARAVAVRIDPTFGTPYPVCKRHVRGEMVPLPDLVAAVREQVAAEIEAQRDAEIATAKPHVCDDADQGMCHTTAAFTASSMAARIARGITP